MYSQPSDFQMPRTIPNYQLHQQNLFQQQIQVFHQQFQAFQQQQHHTQSHPHPPPQQLPNSHPHPHPHAHQQPQQRQYPHQQQLLLNQCPRNYATSANCVDTPPSSSASSSSPNAITDEQDMAMGSREPSSLSPRDEASSSQLEGLESDEAEEHDDDDELEGFDEIGRRRRRDAAGSSSNRRSGRGRSKRVRTIFTPEQLKRLEQEFSIQMYLVGPDRGLLANSLCLTEAQVKVWFQNRRIKFRKLNSGSPPTIIDQPNTINNIKVENNIMDTTPTTTRLQTS